MITGSLVALITPMLDDGSVDFSALERLVEWHIDQGTHGIVAVGTTGESPTLAVDEHMAVIKRVVGQVAGRIAVIAGTGANCTREAIEWTRAAKEMGADAALLVVPYYNKPTQEGLYQHYKAIAEAVDIPQILYNVPGRTITDMDNDTVLRLAELPNIVGIKDATGDLARGRDLIARLPADFAVYSGDDPTACELILAGGKGDISVTANVLPKDMAKMCELALAGEGDEARGLNEQMNPAHQDLFVEANPIPVKWAVAELGLCGPTIRLPLTSLLEENQTVVKQALQVTGAFDQV
ncbi:MAG: 4-hydroxy-tetrahydrodipicolinate synthase [Cellvibrionaceae bacterium]